MSRSLYHNEVKAQQRFTTETTRSFKLGHLVRMSSSGVLVRWWFRCRSAGSQLTVQVPVCSHTSLLPLVLSYEHPVLERLIHHT